MGQRKKTILIHIGFILALLLTSIISNMPLEFNKVREGDIMSREYMANPFIKQSILDYHQFPHWVDFYMGGMPFFANSMNVVLYFWNIIFLIFPLNVENLIILRIIITPFLAGFFMYLLMTHIKLKPKYAFISGLVFMLNSEVRRWSYSWLERADTIILVPLVLLFLMLTFEKKNWIKYAIFTGILIALQLHTGGFIPMLFTGFIFICFFISKLINKNIIGITLKIGIVILIIGTVFAGLTAIKLMPLLEFKPLSSKTEGFSYQNYIGKHHEIWPPNKFLDLLTTQKSNIALKIGFMGTGILLLSLTQLKKKKTLFFWFLAIFALLISTGSILNYPFWKFIPGFKSIHHVYRAGFIFLFSAAALIGITISNLMPKIKQKFRLKESYMNIITITIILIIIFELGIVQIKYQKRVPMDFKEQMKQNELMNYLSEQPGIFRIHNIDTRMLGGWAQNLMFYNKLQMLYGNTPAWIPEYMNVYLSVSLNDPAKFWGMLNTKYIYAQREVNNSYFEFVKKFNNCTICKEDTVADTGIAGPYLYKNKKNLPRAYLVENAILIVGEEDPAKQTMYGIMLKESFNPSNSVIILNKQKIDDYDINQLTRFKTIILTQGSIGENSQPILQQYLDQGGILLPNIISGQNIITEEDIEKILTLSKGDYTNVKEINISYYSPNQIILDIKDQKGFLVLAEKFFMFKGWKAETDNKDLEILRANGINSAIYLNEEERILTVEYKPKSFRNGMIITLTTIFLIIAYFIYNYKTSKKPKNHPLKDTITSL